MFKFNVSYNPLDGHELCILNKKVLKAASIAKK